jgi:hypothetical protein
VHDSLKAGDMPPAGKPQPADVERKQLLAWLESTMDAPDLKGAREPGQPMLRRLTRLEYNNTLRDLLGLPTDLLTFPERLPFGASHYDPSKDRLPDTLKLEAFEYG